MQYNTESWHTEDVPQDFCFKFSKTQIYLTVRAFICLLPCQCIEIGKQQQSVVIKYIYFL